MTPPAAQWRDTEEWVTVAVGAARLHVDPRQLRRTIARLPENVRTPAEERPAKVLWSAIRPAECPDIGPADVSIVRQTSDMSGQSVDAGDVSEGDEALISGDRAANDAKSSLSGVSEVSGQSPAELSEVRTMSETGPANHLEPTDDRSKLIAHLESEVAEKNQHIRALLRIVDEDREELRKLRAQAALPEPPLPEPAPPAEPAPTAPPPTWWHRTMERIRRWPK